jgi:hypothetical protein
MAAIAATVFAVTIATADAKYVPPHHVRGPIIRHDRYGSVVLYDCEVADLGPFDVWYCDTNPRWFTASYHPSGTELAAGRARKKLRKID